MFLGRKKGLGMIPTVAKEECSGGREAPYGQNLGRNEVWSKERKRVKIGRQPGWHLQYEGSGR